MRKSLLAAAAAVAVVTAGFAPALASAAPAPAVHHARCTGVADVQGTIACTMIFAVGRHPGDVRAVVRTSKEERVDGIWWLACGSTILGAGDLNGRTTLREHLLGQAKARGRCRMGTGAEGHKGSSLELVVSWVSR